MSIDLGSQFMKIGLVKPGMPMEIVLNRESHRKTHSIVAIKGEERAFSDAAAAAGIRTPDQTYMHLVDLLGKKFDNPIVHLHQKRFPFYKTRPDDNRGTVMFETKSGEHYSPETLIAMILSEARKMTEKFAEQPVKDVVITVPPYFNQAERRAMAAAAELAGLNLLQLVNDNTAAGLNYGVFRMKEFTEKSQTLLIFDMGATKTTATIFEYQIVKDKSSSEKYPQMTTLGVGYDRTLGGLEISLRMRDHLLKALREAKKFNVEVADSPRAMAKLFKEAERIKQVLSANVDHIAQIENVHEDYDFRLKVTREELIAMNEDLFERVKQPVLDALKMAEMSVDQVDQVVLLGAGTRVPKVQEKLQAALGGKELAKFLNTDEAIAMGAVYQAAHLSKGFKVKKFVAKEINLFPIQVDFKKQAEKEEEEVDKPRIIHRVIYGHKAPYPAKKMLTFAKHTKDFEFALNYGDLKFMSAEQLSHFGELNISRVDLTGIAEAIAANEGEGVEFKGVKAHFRLDDSGIIHVEATEVVIERPVKEEESAFASIAGKISGFFSGKEAEKDGEDKDKKDEKQPAEGEEKKEEKVEKEEAKKEETDAPTREDKKEDADKDKKDKKKKKDKKEEKSSKSDDSPKADNTTETANKTVEVKPQTVKVPLKVEESSMDIVNMTDSERKAARKRLSDFDNAEAEKAKREGAQNALEAFVYDMGDKLEQEEYQSLSTEEEREEINKQLNIVREWMDGETGPDTKTEEFEERLKTLKTATKEVFYRRDQATDRPRAVEAITQMLNHSSTFLRGIRNLTADLQIFTETEMNVLEKLVNESQAWWDEKREEQEKLKGHEKPAYTITDVAEKVKALDREMKYLLNKAKYAKPPKAKNTTTTSNATKEETGETTEKSEKETADSDAKTDSATEDAEQKTEEDEQKTEESPETPEEQPEEQDAGDETKRATDEEPTDERIEL
uniref:Hypoxia up-regulated protein 1 n=1 Tax=Plectus sambesii TaxID=2011161 RepID=A0A914VZ10_9BILA